MGRLSARGFRRLASAGIAAGTATPAATLVRSQPARSEPMERLLLLDGNGLIYRGYYALIDQPLTTSKGELVTAVFGFTNIVLRAIADVNPDHIAVAFDLGKPTFRHERYAEYKATRTRMPDDMREQIPKVREVVKALGIPVYEREGFEADDVIATLAGQAEAAGLEVTILTGDLDMLQLVGERTRLMGQPPWRRREHGRPTTSRRSTSAGDCGPTRCSTTSRSRATPRTTSRASPGWGRRRRRS